MVTSGRPLRELVLIGVVTEVGSAPNGYRCKFLSLLDVPSVSQIIIEHRDCCRLRASHKLDKMLVCVKTDDHVDRDINAAKNLRD